MLLADPSELRFGSRLPDALRHAAKSCPNLEEQTGADLLLSPLRLPFGTNELLKRHVEAGLLIQRKTGLDLSSSITDGRLFHSLYKMLQWTERPWLVVVGHLENRGSSGFIDGRETLSYSAIQGALDYYQIRGGYLSLLHDDEAFVEWVNHCPAKLKAVADNPEKVLYRKPLQTLAEDQKLGMLLALPGLGPERARALYEAARGSLARALIILTADSGMEIRGIGEGTRQAVRKWLSIGGWEQLALVDERLLPDLMEFTLEHDWEKGAPLYAKLASGLGVECVGFDSWDDWLEDLK
jgi:ERCC4-type nuclease